MDLLETVPVIYWKQFQLSTGKSSRYLFERVSGIYLKEFHGSTGNSSRYLFERVSGIYLKEFQAPTGKSSRDLPKRFPVFDWKQFQAPISKSFTYLSERVPSTYWKEFQGSTGKSCTYLVERVLGIYGKEFQVCIGKKAVWATEQFWMWGNRTSVTLPVSVVKHQNWAETFMPLACIITCQYVNDVSYFALQYKHAHGHHFYEMRIGNRHKKLEQVSGAFGKLRNATFSFVTFVCPHGTTRLTVHGLS
jgi:hypothetical protein